MCMSGEVSEEGLISCGHITISRGTIIQGYPVEDGTYGRPEYGEDPRSP